MTKKKPTPRAPSAGVTAAPSPPPDPIDVIAQHWSDLTGLPRKDALALLAQIGHCTMKDNRAGVATFRRELEALVDAKSSEQAARE